MKNCRRSTFSSEAARDICLCSRVRGCGEELPGRREFNQLAVQHKRRGIADAGRLLHVVRDDGKRARRLQLEQEFFNLRGVHRIESGTRFVQK